MAFVQLAESLLIALPDELHQLFVGVISLHTLR
jgi:hypothetical protein